MKEQYQIRLAEKEDIKEIVRLHEAVQGEGEWAQNLIDGTHPVTDHNNFTVVYDNDTNKIVSSMCYIPQTWKYEGIPFSCARMEMVSTLSEHRNKGLVRQQFNYLHEICKAKGIDITAVVGISWFYRKFGYDLSLRYNNSYIVSARHLVKQYMCDNPAYRFESAGVDDLQYYKQLQSVCMQRYRVICDAPDKFWQQLYCNDASAKLKLYIIKNQESRPIGAIAVPPETDEGVLDVLFCELSSGESWLDASSSIFSFLKEIYPEQVEYFRFVMPPGHPLYSFTQEAAAYQPKTEAPFAWYVRIGEYESFIKSLAPYFQDKIAHSILPDYTGEIKISFYAGGLSMSFINGMLTTVETGLPKEPNAYIPQELFKQLLFGYKSLAELQSYSAEANVSGAARVVLDTLFPKQESSFISVQ